MKSSEYLQHDAVGLAELVARGETTAAELLELALGQSAKAQPKTNAICRMMEGEARSQLTKQLTGPFAGVPFLIRAGKRLAVTATEVMVRFREPPQRLFELPDGCNHVRFRLGPDRVAIGLGARVKKLGEAMQGQTTELMAYDDERGAMTAYERLIGDALHGEQILFARQDSIEAAWRIVDGALKNPPAPFIYEQKSWGPSQADALAAPMGGWFNPGGCR